MADFCQFAPLGSKLIRTYAECRSVCTPASKPWRVLSPLFSNATPADKHDEMCVKGIPGMPFHLLSVYPGYVKMRTPELGQWMDI